MLGLAIVAWSPSVGQEGKAEKPKAAKKEKEAKGRLPAYYGEVVSEEQRAKIYEIQKKYAQQIENLQAQLEALRVKQNEEIEAVLTKEQLDKVNALREAAGAKKKKKAEEKDKKASPAAKAEGK
jgi:hypothetical protein